MTAQDPAAQADLAFFLTLEVPAPPKPTAEELAAEQAEYEAAIAERRAARLAKKARGGFDVVPVDEPAAVVLNAGPSTKTCGVCGRVFAAYAVNHQGLANDATRLINLNEGRAKRHVKACAKKHGL